MTLCPIALVAGCQKCPIVALCPLKGVIGDYREPEEVAPPPLPPSAPRRGRRNSQASGPLETPDERL